MNRFDELIELVEAKSRLAEIEKWYFQFILNLNYGNRTQTAADLGISIRSVRNKITEYRIEESMEALSGAEMAVVENVVIGLSNKEAAENLFVTEKTIKFHLTKIYKKLNVKSRAQLIVKYGEPKSDLSVDQAKRHTSDILRKILKVKNDLDRIEGIVISIEKELNSSVATFKVTSAEEPSELRSGRPELPPGRIVILDEASGYPPNPTT